jgi:7-keto-8-aminopelargonate synthetase-like enzyme
MHALINCKCSHTYLQTLVSQGGFVVASRPLIDYLSAFGFVFTASLATSTAAAALAALRVLRAEPWRVAALERNVAAARGRLRARGCSVAERGGPLLHVVAGKGGDGDAMAAWRAAFEGGVYVHPVLFPMAARGAGGLRVTLGAGLDSEALDTVVEVVAAAAAFAGAGPAEDGNGTA